MPTSNGTKPTRKGTTSLSLVSLTLMLLATCMLTVSGANPASADAFGYPNPGFVADSADHWYCLSSTVTGSYVGRIDTAMQILDSGTSSDISSVSTATCGSETDIVWIRNDGLSDPYGNLIRGQTICCGTWVYWTVCGQYAVSYNQLEIYSESVTN